MIGTIIIVTLLIIAACWLLIKVIKKLVVAILACLVLILLVLGGFGFYVYQDVTKIMQIDDAKATVIFTDGTKKLVGYEIPIQDKQLLTEQAKGIGEVEKVLIESASDTNPILIIDKPVYEYAFRDSVDLKTELGLASKEFTFTLKGIPITITLSDYDLVLSKSEILSVLGQGEGYTQLFNIILQKNRDRDLIAQALKLVGEQGTKTLFVNVVEPDMRKSLSAKNVTLQEALFFLALDTEKLKQMDSSKLISGIYSEDISVYPNHITFDVVKALPQSFVESQAAKYLK
jgi:hypothetical protein